MERSRLPRALSPFLTTEPAMTRTTLALLTAALLCRPAVAQDKTPDPPPPPKGPPPAFVTAHMKDGKLHVEMMVPVASYVTEQREKAVIVNGQQQKVTYQVNVLSYKMQLRTMPTAGARFYTA